MCQPVCIVYQPRWAAYFWYLTHTMNVSGRVYSILTLLNAPILTLLNATESYFPVITGERGRLVFFRKDIRKRWRAASLVSQRELRDKCNKFSFCRVLWPTVLFLKSSENLLNKQTMGFFVHLNTQIFTEQPRMCCKNALLTEQCKYLV